MGLVWPKSLELVVPSASCSLLIVVSLAGYAGEKPFWEYGKQNATHVCQCTWQP